MLHVVSSPVSSQASARSYKRAEVFPPGKRLRMDRGDERIDFPGELLEIRAFKRAIGSNEKNPTVSQ
jgi:hypothetical protein